MDIVAIIAERKIEEAQGNGLFDALPARGRIECSVYGEAFFARWLRERFGLKEEADRTHGA